MSMMDQLGTDFHATGSVMTPAQLHEYRLKRGECVTCGRKCFQKKLFKMIPITDHGRVLKGRCLNCSPLDSSDVKGDGAIPAVSRRATQEDLARFSKSQSNLGKGPAMPPGPLQRAAAASARSNSGSSGSGTGARRPRMSASSSGSETIQSMAAQRQTFTRGLSQRSNASSSSTENRSDQHSMGNNISRNSTGSGRRMSRSHQKRSSSQHLHGNSSIRSTSRESLGSNDESVASMGRERANAAAGYVIEEEESNHQDVSDHQHEDMAYQHSPVSRDGRRFEGNHSDHQRNHYRSDSPDNIMSSSAHAIMNRKGSHNRSPRDSEAEDVGSFDGDEYYDETGVVSVDSANGRYSAGSRTRSYHSHDSRSVGSRNRHRSPERDVDGDNESFTNASENYDDYAPLPDFHAAAGLIHPSGDDIQDALERIAGAAPQYEGGYPVHPHEMAHMDPHHQYHSGDEVGPDPNNYYGRRQSERSLGSTHSYQNNLPRGRDSSNRSLRSDRSGHNTDDEMMAYENSLVPKHGVLNRGGAVNLMYMTGGGTQPQKPQDVPYGSGHVMTSARGDIYRSSNRSLDSVSSFGGEDSDAALIAPTMDRQESVRSACSQGRVSRGLSFNRLNGSTPTPSRQPSVEQQLGSTSVHSYRQAHDSPASYASGNGHPHDNMNSSGHSLTIGAVGQNFESKNSDSYHSASGETYMNSSASRQNSGATSESIDEGMRQLNLAGADFIQIIRIMHDFQDTEPVLSNCMQEISNLQLSPEDCDIFTDEGGIDVVVESMRRYPEEAELQLCACRALCNISGTQENQLALVDMGVADLLLEFTMENFADVPELQEQAMAALANLAALESNLEHLIEMEVVSRVVQAMNKHGNDTQVQMKGCSVITNLASHPSPMKASVMMAGGGGAVVLSMVLHSKDPQLQEKGLQALRNLSANCEENKIELAHIGGIDASITAMQVHRDNPFIQEAGAWTLCNLAGNMDNKQQIGASGGIDVVVRAMWVHSEQTSVHEWCARALFSLSLHQANGQVILEVGGVSAIVNSMQAHEKSSVVQEMGCAILCNLANEEAAKLRIVDEEALDAIVLAMVLFGEDAKVQERACQVLLQLAIAQNVTAMHASNVLELVRVASGNFPDICGEPALQLISMLDEFSAGYNSSQGGIPVGGVS